MEFDEALGSYVYKFNGIIFAWDEEPDDDYKDTVVPIAESYHSHIDAIVAHMLPHLKAFFGDITADEVKNSLGEPTFYVEDYIMTYLEHTLDDSHIIEVEILDETFDELGYVVIDG